MNIRLVDFKEGDVVEVERVYDPKELDIEFVDLKYSSDLKLEGTVEKGEDTLVFRGRLCSRIERICGRCLTPVKGKVDQPFELYYEIKGQDVVETTDDLREVLILDHPLSFVCQESCKGLCLQCGANLNLKNCGCPPPSLSGGAAAFVQLKQLWEKKQEKKKHG